MIKKAIYIGTDKKFKRLVEYEYRLKIEIVEALPYIDHSCSGTIFSPFGYTKKLFNFEEFQANFQEITDDDEDQ